MSFKKYKRTNVSEMRHVTQEEIEHGLDPRISLSAADRENGSPKPGDMIARNPQDHGDMWLVAAEYFVENFEEA